MMKKIPRTSIRAKLIPQVLASLRIERLAPSSFVERGMHDCLSGQLSTKVLLEKTLQRHVALRRS